ATRCPRDRARRAPPVRPRGHRPPWARTFSLGERSRPGGARRPPAARDPDRRRRRSRPARARAPRARNTRCRTAPEDATARDRCAGWRPATAATGRGPAARRPRTVEGDRPCPVRASAAHLRARVGAPLLRATRLRRTRAWLLRF